ncbi:hypothetical protein QQG09_01595 [Melissococcus plutonius]|uniref:Uncharacterized protein n=1 Tax=Melissococcus plutonius TaxID=33970 RepID=A0A2Z5Y2H2_9ENTE|nr:hypothetical protein [Melissococcus plutonius]BAL62110.1 hypothetical protein MPD5_0871 [Melissococcus plutonius DAT561]MCV2497876.1 hypothetical protein [Melissococcus plutonius]MCV2500517.1 hypothetical protein [Melissococcus plutonius]MCV2505215.1 hypothetical protein [Melissococcus plutonius]MCV2506491.1 hypothetical protein [Melissococcus plutonius]
MKKSLKTSIEPKIVPQMPVQSYLAYKKANRLKAELLRLEAKWAQCKLSGRIEEAKKLEKKMVDKKMVDKKKKLTTCIGKKVSKDK